MVVVIIKESANRTKYDLLALHYHIPLLAMADRRRAEIEEKRARLEKLRQARAERQRSEQQSKRVSEVRGRVKYFFHPLIPYILLTTGTPNAFEKGHR